MTLTIKNESSYLGEHVAKLVRAGVRCSHMMPRFKEADLAIVVVDARGPYVRVEFTSNQIVRLRLPPADQANALSPCDIVHAIRAARWAAVARFTHKRDMTKDQQLIWTSEWPLELDSLPVVHRRVGHTARDPEARRRAHAKKLLHAEAMLKKAERRRTFAQVSIDRLTRKLAALRAATDRVGLPSGAPRPQVTEAQIETTDSAIDALEGLL